MILLTGASGFVGKRLLKKLKNNDSKVVTVFRGEMVDKEREKFVHGIDSATDWSDKLLSVDIIIHCAARVHVMREYAKNPLEEFREVNVLGTMKLARSAAEAGVKRFIFVSSIKVNGESTTGKKPYTSTDQPAPEDPYGISKAEAEEQLIALGKETGMEIVIIRPPLVYGAGVKANFAAICNLVSKGLPLPFGSLSANKRSMVYVGNLISLIIECVKNEKAANQIFLVSDNDDLSLSDFIKRLSIAMGKNTLLLPFPKSLFELAGKLTGKTTLVDRLVGSLQVDINHTCQTLDWTPPYSVEDGFTETVKDFQK
ncbi:SDR family oxidoreductase [Thalassotalea crassostreae]|uniref:UDP-glucose 4-epimerase family protein n=1 Tax=Thalassotalea crassostreae TaxID=1763536 RepID=UPI000AC2F0F1